MLQIDPVAVLTQSIAFILLAVFLGKFAFGPIGAMIESRRKEIQETLEQVAEDRRAMERARSDYEQRLAGIEAEARERIAAAVTRAQEEAGIILSSARDEASAQRERALADIDQERKKAIVQIRTEMADLAVIAAGKILEREITPAVHRDLISDFIGDVGARS